LHQRSPGNDLVCVNIHQLTWWTEHARWYGHYGGGAFCHCRFGGRHRRSPRRVLSERVVVVSPVGNEEVGYTPAGCPLSSSRWASLDASTLTGLIGHQLMLSHPHHLDWHQGHPRRRDERRWTCHRWVSLDESTTTDLVGPLLEVRTRSIIISRLLVVVVTIRCESSLVSFVVRHPLLCRTHTSIDVRALK
jgi:hypothetical protein